MWFLNVREKLPIDILVTEGSSSLGQAPIHTLHKCKHDLCSYFSQYSFRKNKFFFFLNWVARNKSLPLKYKPSAHVPADTYPVKLRFSCLHSWLFTLMWTDALVFDAFKNRGGDLNMLMTSAPLRCLINTGPADFVCQAQFQLDCYPMVAHSRLLCWYRSIVLLHTCMGYTVNSLFLSEPASYLCPDIYKVSYPP